jgi:hypothetical protein
MSLPVFVESQDQVPEGMTDYYHDDGNGRFVLKIDGVTEHPEVSSLYNAYKSEQERRKSAIEERDRYKQKAEVIPEDMEPEIIQQVIERFRTGKVDENKDDDSKKHQADWLKVDPEKIRKQVEQKFREDLDNLDNQLKLKENQLRNLIIDNELTSAISNNKISYPPYQKAVKQLWKDSVEVVENEDGSISTQVDLDGVGPVSLDQAIRVWAAGDEGSAFVDGNVGSGARGAGAGFGPKGKKEINRDQFDGMSPEEKTEFIQKGGRIV